MRRGLTVVSSLLLMTLALAACWVGSATIGGTLSGLPTGASVTLQNNAKDNLTRTTNGSFTFATTVDENKPYDVTVLTQPAGATCTPSNASGNVDGTGSNVTNVVVTCVISDSISGTVTGLPAGFTVSLANNGGTPLIVGTDGAFAFPGIVAAGTAYNVTVSAQPVNGTTTCTVPNGSGTVASGTATAIVVTCT